MEKVKKLFTPTDAEDEDKTYRQHQAGRPDSTYHRERTSESGVSGGGTRDSYEGYGTEQSATTSGSAYQREGVTDSGIGGGMKDDTGNYGATPGTGISSYTGGSSQPTSTPDMSSSAYGKQPASSTTTESSGYNTQPTTTSTTSQSTYGSKDPTALNYGNIGSSTTRDTTIGAETSSSAMPGGFPTSPTNERGSGSGTAPQIGGSNAPQLGKPDFGGNLDTSTMGSSSYATTGPGYGSSDTGTSGSGLTSSEYAGAGAGAAGAGLGSTTLADRSIGSNTGNGTSTVSTGGMGSGGYGNVEPGLDRSKIDTSGSHQTFTGNRLDPRFTESKPSYHEEQLSDQTHHGAGWTESPGTGTSQQPGVAYTTSGATAMPSSTSRDPYTGNTVAADPTSTSSRSMGTDTTMTSSSTQPTSSSHNYGRDAAIGAGAAGAGAAGYGMLSKGQGEPVDTTNTGPASNTVGPHSSNFANVMDPRVKPEPAKQHGHSTVGPHQSDMMNKMDPKVTSDPQKAYEKENAQTSSSNYGGDAALAGGAGAAGAGAYSAYDSRQGPAGTTNDPSSQTGSAGGAYSTYDQGRPPPSSTTQTASSTQRSTDPITYDSNYGRDAAVVGGAGAAGAAGYGAYSASQDPSATRTHDPTHQHSAHDPYSTEHHADRDIESRKQTGGGMFGFLHKNQDSKYADKMEPDTTARDKYYGNDGATHGFDHSDPTGSSTTHGTRTGDYDSHYNRAPLQSTSHDAFYHDPTGPDSTHGTSSGYGTTGAVGGTALGGAAGHSATQHATTDDSKFGSSTGSHDYSTGRSSAGVTHQEQGGSAGRTSADEGRASMDSQGRPRKRSFMDKMLHRENPNKLHKEPPGDAYGQ